MKVRVGTAGDDKAAVAGHGHLHTPLLVGPTLAHAAVERLIVTVKRERTSAHLLRQLYRNTVRLLAGIDPGYIPCVTVTTAEHHIPARITVDISHLVPRRRHRLHEIHGPDGSVLKIVWREGKVLHRALKQYGRSQGKHIGGDAT